MDPARGSKPVDRTRPRTLCLVVAMALLAGDARAAPSPGVRDFVGVRGTSFTLRGKPFHFLGANVGVMHGPTERNGYKKTLDAAKRDGMAVVRVWALGEGPTTASPWHKRWQLFRAGPRGWLSHAPRQLDRVLAHARKQGLRVILTLANNWAAYGGAPQYLRWAQLSTARYADLDRFYSDARIRRWYRKHVLRLVNRRSTVTGIRYGDDPTIMAWELFNESSISPGGFAARRRFLRDMAKLIRTHAPEQLVSAGVTGYATLGRRAEWLRVCRLPELDFCDAHLYPEETWRLRRPQDVDDLIDDRVQLAHHVAGKPLLFGEFGFTPHIRRRRGALPRSQGWWVARFLRRVRYDGAGGALIWLYLPHSKAPRRFPVWVDHPSSLPLRRVLRRWAARLRAGPPRRLNPRLGRHQSTRPLYRTQVTVRQRAPRRRWVRLAGQAPGVQRRRVTLAITDYTRARFTHVGHYARGLLTHVYGAGHGFVQYRIPRLARRRGWQIRALTVDLRLSSEYPGAKAPATGVSRVQVALGGQRVSQLLAAPDDGQGRAERIRVRDRRLLARLQRRPLTLRLDVPWGKQARGLCIYGGLGHLGKKQKLRPQGFFGSVRITATLASTRRVR